MQMFNGVREKVLEKERSILRPQMRSILSICDGFLMNVMCGGEDVLGFRII